jgi:serpin B
MSSIVEASNSFALNLYSQFRDGDANMFFSPLSISNVGAMLYEGAHNNTADQILDVFGFPKGNKERRSFFAELHQRLNASGRPYTLRTANALWAEKTYRFLKEYVDTIKNYYGGEARNIDFVNDTEGSTNLINDWVDSKTEHRITDMFGPGSLNKLTRLILTNAIYFKGDWARQFDKSYTNDENFYVKPDKAVKVPMMNMLSDSFYFRYAEDERMQVLEMPYKGNDLSMLVFLPKKNDLRGMEESIDSKKLMDLRRRMHGQKVNIWMPKFELKTSYNLNSTLKDMGMSLPFGISADFSGMDGTHDLYVDQMKHNAFVRVDEEGTEAAAATGATMLLRAVMEPQPKIFRADHPFMFTINECYSGNILFMGRVINPKTNF